MHVEVSAYGYPPLDPDQRALDLLRFVRFAVKPTLSVTINHDDFVANAKKGWTTFSLSVFHSAWCNDCG
jgi:hypothetical protein